MNKIYLNKKKLIFVLTIFFISLILCALSISDSKAYAYIEIQNENFTNTEIQEDLIDNSIIVVLDENISGINKIHSPEFFNGIEIDKIIDLTRRKYNVNNENGKFKQILQIYLKQFSEDIILQTANKLEQIDGVLCAEPNYSIRTAMAANDTKYSEQWNLNDISGIGVSGAWDITTGSENIRVGIIDTGIANHPDLSSNLGQGYDYYSGNDITTDDINGHGTKVAGVIGAIGNNSQGVAGINWNVTMIPLQASYLGNDNKTYLDRTAIISAINEATDKWGTTEQIDIINYSVSNFGNNSEVLSAVANYPGLFVWSAGNNGVNVDTYSNINDYDLDNLISVGAINKSNERSVWTDTQSSCYGSHVNIFAPGGKEFTNSENIPTTNNNADYCYFNGTSAAAPHVTGVAALLLSIEPTLTSAELKEIILSSADDITISTPSGSQVVKKLNAYEAVRSIKYTVSFSNDGHISRYNNIDVKYGDPMPKVDFFAPKKEGHAFECYSDSIENTTNKYYIMGIDDDKQTADLNMLDHAYIEKVYPVSGVKWDHATDTTLYAHWVPLEGYVTYENATTGKVLSTTTEYLKTGETTLTPKEISGYNFSHFMIDGQKVEGTKLNLVLYRSYSNEIKVKGGLTAVYEESSCLAAGSLITLADGRQIAVEDLTGNESLLVWNLHTGTYDSAPILFIDSDPLQLYKVINLTFSDGTAVKVISEHGFWDYDLSKYVYLDENAEKYIGHWFNKGDSRVQLVGVEINEEYTSAYSPVTYGHLCYFVNGMLSMPGGIGGLFNIFDVDSTLMKYDETSMSLDIQTYGLFTYEEFTEYFYLPESAFEAFNGQYLKVAIGKGIITIEELSSLYDRYGEYLV